MGSSSPDALLPGRRRSFARALNAWFDEHARTLPWRGTRDLYSIWVSEIMLQQTQVATVIGYYTQFMKRFPTIDRLARADEQDVLRAWEGLGYYRRARQLHQAARVIVQRHEGQFPVTMEQARGLPGIGRYTAAAVLSIGLDARQAILEANTRRLYARLVAERGDAESAATQSRLWDFAESLLPPQGVGHFNQALMELGSMVCTPRQPGCDACPVARMCQARVLGLADRIPAPKRKKQYEEAAHVAVVIQRAGQVLLRQCGADRPQTRNGNGHETSLGAGRWVGLWDFPRFELERTPDDLQASIVEKTRAETGVAVQLRGQLNTIKHSVTRFRITLQCHLACFVRGRLRRGGWRWFNLDELARLPLNSTGRKISKQLRP